MGLPAPLVLLWRSVSGTGVRPRATSRSTGAIRGEELALVSRSWSATATAELATSPDGLTDDDAAK